MPISEIYNCDRMEFLSKFPDKYFDLIIDDPPYGIGEDGSKNKSRGCNAGFGKRKQYCESRDYKPYCGGDIEPPSAEYFKELIRVSKNQIIFGANHFISRIPIDSHCWIVWDKDNGANDFADCELAWTSFQTAVRKFKYRWHGMLQENMKNKEVRIHPNQKPVALYGWLLNNYAKSGYKIGSPHMGSQSDRIAAYKLGFDFWGCDKDEHYFKTGDERFRSECFGETKTSKGILIQPSLFGV